MPSSLGCDERDNSVNSGSLRWLLSPRSKSSPSSTGHRARPPRSPPARPPLPPMHGTTETCRWATASAASRSDIRAGRRSEEHTSELQSLMRISYAVFCLKKKNTTQHTREQPNTYKKHTQQHMNKNKKNTRTS